MSAQTGPLSPELEQEFQTDYRSPALAWTVRAEAQAAAVLTDECGNVWRPAGLREDGDVVVACDEPQDPKERGDGPSYPWTVGTVLSRFGLLTPSRVPVSPSGCRWCGIDRREHCQQWKQPAGWHRWEPPTVEQVKTRMLARRACALAVKAVAA